MRTRRKVPLIVFVSVTGTFWVIAGALLVASWRSGQAAERARDAPRCAAHQVFTDAGCQITLPGKITKITGSRLDVSVDGRTVSSSVTLSGNLPDASSGVPVEVTIYRGVIIHVESTRLLFDTDAAPSTKRVDYRNFGSFFLVFGTVLGVYSTVKTIERPSLTD